MLDCRFLGKWLRLRLKCQGKFPDAQVNTKVNSSSYTDMLSNNCCDNLTESQIEIETDGVIVTTYVTM